MIQNVANRDRDGRCRVHLLAGPFLPSSLGMKQCFHSAPIVVQLSKLQLVGKNPRNPSPHPEPLRRASNEHVRLSWIISTILRGSRTTGLSAMFAGFGVAVSLEPKTLVPVNWVVQSDPKMEDSPKFEMDMKQVALTGPELFVFF